MSVATPELSYVLVSEGSSDIVIIDIVDKAVHQRSPDARVHGDWVDLRANRKRPSTLAARIRTALARYPDIDFLLVHRDSDDREPQCRRTEIEAAVEHSAAGVRSIPVVPVRSVEAWLLVDPDAIRMGAGNPNGTKPLQLPRPRDVEGEHDPKTTLRRALQDASGLKGRRLKKFNVGQARHRAARALSDLDVLRQLPAYRVFEDELFIVINELAKRV